jgi:hypothetical protein
MNVFELARLPLSELRARYLLLVPSTLRFPNRSRALLESMSREQLVAHILEATP